MVLFNKKQLYLLRVRLLCTTQSTERSEAHIAFILKQNTAHNTEHRAKRTEHTLTGNAQNQQQSSLRAWGGWGQPSLRSSSSWAFVDKKRGPGQSHCQSQKLPATKVNCPSAAAAAWPDALRKRHGFCANEEASNIV